MKRVLSAGSMILAAGFAAGQTTNFELDAVGQAPAGWQCGVTGGGAPKWSVERDPTAPSPPNVLRQSGSGDFPWCVKTGTSITNGLVEVRFKSVSGREDRAGGLVWRWKDGENYYVARANALENNVSLYFTRRGSRKTLKYVDAPLAVNVWHLLRVEFVGDRIKVFMDGRLAIDEQDAHIAGSGAVGVWTKADSITAFDDFRFAPAMP